MYQYILKARYAETSPEAIAEGFPAVMQTEKSFSMDPAASWVSTLAEMLDFLSGVYGYDLKSRVFVNDPRGFVISVDEARMNFIGAGAEEYKDDYSEITQVPLDLKD